MGMRIQIRGVGTFKKKSENMAFKKVAHHMVQRSFQYLIPIAPRLLLLRLFSDDPFGFCHSWSCLRLSCAFSCILSFGRICINKRDGLGFLLWLTLAGARLA